MYRKKSCWDIALSRGNKTRVKSLITDLPKFVCLYQSVEIKVVESVFWNN